MKKQGRKYFPARVSASQAQRAKELRRVALSAVQRCRSVYRVFQRFCAINGIDHHKLGDALPLWVAQLEDSLAVRTVRLYIKQIRKYDRFLLDPASFVAPGLLRLCNTRSTSAPRRHALDIPGSVVEEMVSFLSNSNPRAFLCAYLMATTGLRFVDLMYLTRGCIKWGRQGTLFVDVRRSKTIKTDWQRQELAIPPRLAFPCAAPLLALFRRELDSVNLDEYIAPEDSSCAEFNRILGESYAHDGRKPTSYSLRRYAFDRFIKAARNEEGVVDWNWACRFSLHMNVATLQAFYYRGPTDVSG